MKFRYLQSFVAVAEELSFTRAAERLHIAQPALSVQIRQLEAEIGVELIDRSRRAISLTTAGAIMLDETRQLLSTLDQAIELVQRASRGAVGRLSIGFVPSASNRALPPLLRSFGASHPEVALHLREMGPDALVTQLHEERLDVSFLYLPFDDPSLDQMVVSREVFVAAIPEGHRLAGRETIDPAVLRNELFVLPARHGMPGLHAQVLDICRDAGFSPRAVQDDVWLVQTIIALVASGVGVAIVPESARQLSRRGLVFRPLRCENVYEVELAAIWRRDDNSTVLQAFLETIEQSELPEASSEIVG